MTTSPTTDRLVEIERIRTRFRALREDVIEILLAQTCDFSESQAMYCLTNDIEFFSWELARGFLRTGHFDAECDDEAVAAERAALITSTISDALLLLDPKTFRWPPVFTQAEDLGLPTT